MENKRSKKKKIVRTWLKDKLEIPDTTVSFDDLVKKFFTVKPPKKRK